MPPHSLVRNQSFTHFYRFHHFSCFFLFSLSLFLDFSFHSLTSSPFLHPTQLHSSPLSSTHILTYPSFLLPHFFHSLVFVGGVVLLDFVEAACLSSGGGNTKHQAPRRQRQRQLLCVCESVCVSLKIRCVKVKKVKDSLSEYKRQRKEE